MDMVTSAAAVKNTTTIRWDTPYRIVCSIVAVAIFAGWKDRERPFIVIAGWFDWAALSAPGQWLRDFDAWLIARLEPEWGAAAAALMALAIAGAALSGSVITANRSPASFWLAVALVAYAGVSPMAIVVFVVVLVLAGIVLMQNDSFLHVAPIDVVLAVLNLTFAAIAVFTTPLVWMLTRDRASREVGA